MLWPLHLLLKGHSNRFQELRYPLSRRLPRWHAFYRLHFTTIQLQSSSNERMWLGKIHFRPKLNVIRGTRKKLTFYTDLGRRDCAQNLYTLQFLLATAGSLHDSLKVEAVLSALAYHQMKTWCFLEVHFRGVFCWNEFPVLFLFGKTCRIEDIE